MAHRSVLGGDAEPAGRYHIYTVNAFCLRHIRGIIQPRLPDQTDLSGKTISRGRLHVSFAPFRKKVLYTASRCGILRRSRHYDAAHKYHESQKNPYNTLFHTFSSF